jgi:hypothetical protein
MPRLRLPSWPLVLVALVLILTPLAAEAQRAPHVHGPAVRAHVRVGVGVGAYPWFGWYGWYGGWYGWYSPYWWPWYSYPYAYDPTGSVRLEVKPRETEVYVDGYLAGTVDDFDGVFQRLRLPPGNYEIVLYLAGHRRVRQLLSFQEGRDFKIRHVMQPLAPGDPPEARPVPTEPPPDRQAGSRVRVPRPPDRGEAEPPTYAPPPEGPRPAPRQQPAAGFGAVSIRVQPIDAEVIIDEERWQGPESGERLVVELSAGTHRLELRKAGFVTYRTQIEVRPGETATLNVSLPRERVR